MSTGDSAQTSRTPTTAHVRQRARSQPASIATAIHMIWKYLFMSNSTALTTTTFGNDEQGDHPGHEEPAPRPVARQERRDDREQDGDAQVGRIEEGDGRRPVADARLAPAEDESERPDVVLLRDRADDERCGEDDRCQEQDGVAPDRPGTPRAGREDVQRDDQVRRREREELERGQERGQDARQEHAQRSPPEARDDEQDDRHQPGQPERRRAVRQEARPEDRGDLEERPAVGPGVVVGQPAHEGERAPVAGDDVADESDPAQPATEADQDGGDGRETPPTGQAHRERPDDERQDAREQRARREVDADQVDIGDGRGDRAMEVGEPVVGQRDAGEVGDLGREVARGDARADRDVDEQVAPVPATGHPAIGRLVPAVGHQDGKDREPGGRRDDPGGGVRAEGSRDARASGPHERSEPAMAHDRRRPAVVATRTTALTMTASRPNPVSRATTFTR